MLGETPYMLEPTAITATLCVENVRLHLFTPTRHEPDLDSAMLKNERNRLLRTSLHTHAMVEAFIVFDGRLSVNFDTHAVTLDENDVLLIAPQCAHRADIELARQCTWANFWFLFEPVKCAAQIDLYGFVRRALRNRPYYVERQSSVAREAIERMLRFKDFGRRYLLGACLYEVLMELNERESRSAARAPLGDSDGMRAAEIDRTINERYMEPVTTGQLAQRLSLSKRQLERVVQKQYGMSFGEMVTRKRVAAAREQLAKGNLSVQDVAYRVGYATPCCFYSAFKKATGTTPARYRQACRRERDGGK